MKRCLVYHAKTGACPNPIGLNGRRCDACHAARESALHAQMERIARELKEERTLDDGR